MEGHVKVVVAVLAAIAGLFGVFKGCQEFRKASEERRTAEIARQKAEDDAKKQAPPPRTPAGSGAPAPKVVPPAPPEKEPEPLVAKWVPETVRRVDPVTGLGYEMHLRSARVTGTELTCELTLVATKERKSLNLGRVANSTATFDTGDSAKLTGIAWGGTPVKYFTIATKDLEPSVPYKVELTFDGAPAAAKRLAALTVQFDYGARGPETLTVKDLELQRKVYK